MPLSNPIVGKDGTVMHEIFIPKNTNVMAGLVSANRDASLWGEDAEFARRSETIRWELRRGTSGWEAVSPNDRTFVPRDVAIRNIAARISDLTQQNRGDRETSRREAARLTKLLGVLLEEDGNNSN